MKCGLFLWKLQQGNGRSIKCSIAVMLWVGFAAFHFLMDNRGASIGDWLYLNYLQGSGRQDWRWFLLQPVYTLGVILTLYVTAGYIRKSIGCCGGMILLLKGSRIRFWLSECAIAFVSTLILACVSAMFSILIFLLFGKSSVTTTTVSAEYVRLWIDKRWSDYRPAIMMLVQETMFIPFLFCILLNFFQLLLSLWRNTILPYLLSVGLFLLIPFFPTMHTGEENIGIFDAARSRWLIVGVIIAIICIVIAGILKVRKADLLGREE